MTDRRAAPPPAVVITAAALPPYAPRLVWLRRIVNVVNLATPLGLVLAVASRSSFGRGPHGVIVARGRPLPFLAPRAMAVTVGDVVLLRASDEGIRRHPKLFDHEARHSAQYAFFLGPVGFLPAYFACCVWSWWQVRNFSVRNAFEMHAGLIEGGYARADGQPH